MNEQPSLAHLAGTTIDTYHIEQLVDQDAQGAVFIASSKTSGTHYRFRVLHLPSTLTPEARMVFLGHFQQQARELKELLSDNEQMPKHPHLLPLVDYGNVQEPQRFLYLVSPHVPMRSLTTLLNEQGALDVLTIDLYLAQIASALEYAHQHGVIHRNLTTDVVFIRNDGRLVIADLGVMRILALSLPADQQVLLYGNSPSSTPAPEQLLGQPAHTYTDVYALGAMLYRLLSRHRVFSADRRDGILQQHLHAPVPSLTKWRQITIGERDVTAELDRLIAAAMAKDPTQRIQHPGELAHSYHQIVVPYDRTRQPFAAPQPDVAPLLAPAPGAAAALKSARMPQGSGRRVSVASSHSAQINESRRRMVLLLGGGGAVVAVGAVAFIVEQILNKNTASTVTGSSSSVSTPASRSGQGSTSSTPSPQKTPIASPSTGHTGTVIARTAEVPLNGAKTFPLPNGAANPGVLVHLQDGKFVAFDSSCTHHPVCSVAYDAQAKLLVCPCHGAEFDPANSASVVQGPAKRPLAPVQITVNADGTVTIA